MKKTISRPHDRWGKIQRESLKYLKGNNLRVYADLLTYADSKGRCYPSVETIANDLDIHPRNVQKALASLEREGWIEKHLRTNTSTIYQLYFVKVYDESKQRGKEKPAKKSNSSDGVAKSTGSGVVKRTAPQVAKNAVSGVAESTTLTDHLTDHNNRHNEQSAIVVSDQVNDDVGAYECTSEERKRFQRLWDRYSVPNEAEGSAYSAWELYCSKGDAGLLQHIENHMSNKTGTYMTNQMKQSRDDYYEKIHRKERERLAEEERKKNPEQSM